MSELLDRSAFSSTRRFASCGSSALARVKSSSAMGSSVGADARRSMRSRPIKRPACPRAFWLCRCIALSMIVLQWNMPPRLI